MIWLHMVLGYARIVVRDRYARAVALALAAWAAARWGWPGAVEWVDAAWALVATLLGVTLAVERVRAAGAARALDKAMVDVCSVESRLEESRVHREELAGLMLPLKDSNGYLASPPMGPVPGLSDVSGLEARCWAYLRTLAFDHDVSHRRYALDALDAQIRNFLRDRAVLEREGHVFRRE